MRPSTYLAAFSLCLLMASGCENEENASDTDAVNAMAPQIVMGWVPHYGIAPGLRALSASYGEIKVVDTLDRLGLQFWTINADGTVSNLRGAQNKDVQPFIELAKEHDLKLLLTVTNDAESLNQSGSSESDRLAGFHWGTVRKAFKSVGTDGVARALLDVVEETGLDGIDLDFEAGGVNNYSEKDQQDFAQLVEELSIELKKQNKLLTVDTFPGSNRTLVPNSTWWQDWQGKVDSLHAMGYENTYKNGLGDASYQQLQDTAIEAGFDAAQLIVGVPVWLNKWAGGDNNIGYSHQENIEFIAHCLKEPSGVALWALQHPEAHTIPESDEKPWNTPEPWTELLKVHEGQERRLSVCETAEEQKNLIDDFLTPESNRLGGRWAASTDYWDRDDKDNASRVLTSDGSYDMARGEGWWGKLDRGYSETEGNNLLSGIVEINGSINSDPGFGGVWMEFIPRDCSQLEDPTDGCGWKTEALVAYDLSDYKELIVTMSCEKDREFSLALDTKSGLADRVGPWGSSITCTGEQEEYALALGGLEPIMGDSASFDAEQVTRLRVQFLSKTAATAEFSLSGISLKQADAE